MQKTVFKIAKMDCPSEERMIRLAIEGHSAVRQLSFELSKREVTLFHNDSPATFFNILEKLNLGCELISTEECDESSVLDTPSEDLIRQGEYSTLKWLLAINLTMFIAELSFGILAQSTALIADSLDMLADAAVYSLSLFAVGRPLMLQKRSARISGYLQISLALLVFIEVMRKFILGSEPEPSYMIIIAAIALIANSFCLWLLHQHKEGGVHMKASWIFSMNDVIANCGVIIAGGLVYLTNSNIPDLAVGILITAIVMRGGLRILKLSQIQSA